MLGPCKHSPKNSRQLKLKQLSSSLSRSLSLSVSVSRFLFLFPVHRKSFSSGHSLALSYVASLARFPFESHAGSAGPTESSSLKLAKRHAPYGLVANPQIS